MCLFSVKELRRLFVLSMYLLTVLQLVTNTFIRSVFLPTKKTTFNIIGLINSISNGLPIQYKNYWNTMSHRIYIFYKFEGTYIAEGHGHCEMKSWLLLEIIK